MFGDRALPLRRALIASSMSGVAHTLLMVTFGLLAAGHELDRTPLTEPLQVTAASHESIERPITTRVQLVPSPHVAQAPAGKRRTSQPSAIGLIGVAAPTQFEMTSTSPTGIASGGSGESQVAAVVSGSGDLGTGEGAGGGQASSDGAAFFGVQARGKRFAFVVDTSGSMHKNRRYLRCRNELGLSLGGLQPDQQYFVVFFNGKPFPMPSHKPLDATDDNRAQTLSWSKAIVPTGMTDPFRALNIVLAQQPDAIFLLTDGSFSESALARILALQSNPQKTPIHTIAFESREGERVLQEIARSTGGTYRYVP